MQLASLRAVVEALPGHPGDVFRSWFSDEEWQELEASEASIASESQGRLRTLRLKRQKQLLDVSCEFAIDLMVHDVDEVGEQSTGPGLHDCRPGAAQPSGHECARYGEACPQGASLEGASRCCGRQGVASAAGCKAKEKRANASKKRPRKESARTEADKDDDEEQSSPREWLSRTRFALLKALPMITPMVMLVMRFLSRWKRTRGKQNRMEMLAMRTMTAVMARLIGRTCSTERETT